MSRRVVYVENGDDLRQPLGVAFLLKELDNGFVRVKFVVGRRNFVVRRSYVNFDYDKSFVVAEKKKKRPHELLGEKALSSKSPAFVPSSAASASSSGAVSANVLSSKSPAFVPSSASASGAAAVQKSDVKTTNRRKKPKSTPTWDRLLRFGSVCATNKLYSEEGVRRLSSLLLPDGVLLWLISLPASSSFAVSMRSFVDVWCTYCGALAHCDYNSMDKRSKFLVLNLVCDDIESGGTTGNVFASLLMQCLVSNRHDQSLCSVIADTEHVGYAKRVDRAKPGVLVSSSALLRHEALYPIAKKAMDRFRTPLERAVWQVKSSKSATTFLRVARGRLYRFPTNSGVSSRLHPTTNEIRYWSSELEKYVPKSEFYTTVDGVSFKKAYQLKTGDPVILSDRVHRVVSVKSHPDGMEVVAEHARSLVCVHKPKNAYVLTGDGTGEGDVACLLKQCPDVTHTLCMSVGHPIGYMKKRKGGGLSAFDTCPIRLPFDQYVVWRCAVSSAVASIFGKNRKAAFKNALRARTHLLVEKA